MKREINAHTAVVAGWGSISPNEWEHYNTTMSAMKLDAIMDIFWHLSIEMGSKEPKKITIKIEIETPEFNKDEKCSNRRGNKNDRH